MSYFPLFTELKDKNVLIIGGGSVALRKAEKLLPYGPRITVVAENVSDEFSRLLSERGCPLPHTILVRAFKDSDLDTADLVIAATDDRNLNAHVAELCSMRRIPVNVVDDAALCTFLFPSLVKRGDLSIGISTGGASPAAAIYTRKTIENALPDCLEEIIAFLASVRPRIMEEVPDAHRRHALFAALFEQCLTKEAPLSEEELKDFIRRH